MPILTFVEAGRPHAHHLREGDNLIGRSATCDLVIPSPDVSRQHAQVRVTGGKVFLKDLGSGEERPLWDGLERDLQEAWAIHGVYPAFDWTPDGATIRGSIYVGPAWVQAFLNLAETFLVPAPPAPAGGSKSPGSSQTSPHGSF